MAAFEALCKGSWQTVKSISIKNATITLNFLNNQRMIKDKSPFPNLRIRSRQATSSDCTCFLRPGVDVCVISTSQKAKSKNEELKHPVSNVILALFYLELLIFFRIFCSFVSWSSHFWHLLFGHLVRDCMFFNLLMTPVFEPLLTYSSFELNRTKPQ